MQPKPIVYVFIDASNLWQAQKAKGKFLDYEKLKLYLKEKCSAQDISIYYYTAYPKEGTRDYSLDGKHKFLTYLKKGLGVIVRKKELKRIHTQSEGGDYITEKGNMDVEITIDAVHTVQKYDIAVLFTGDSDFLSLIKYIKSRDKKVYIYSSYNNISSELRTMAHEYIDILDLDYDIWGRKLEHRKK